MKESGNLIVKNLEWVIRQWWGMTKETWEESCFLVQGFNFGSLLDHIKKANKRKKIMMKELKVMIKWEREIEDVGIVHG